MAIEPSGAARPALRLETGSPVRAVSDCPRHRRGRSELDWVQRPASCPQDGQPPAQESAGPRSPARASSLHAIPAVAGAVYRVEGQAHATVAPRLVKTIGDRQGRDLRLSAPCPICVQKGLPWARLRWSALDGATPSGAVSAGSSPAGGTGQRHKFEHSDNLDPSQPWACDLRLRNGAVIFAPHALPEWPPLLLRRRSWHIAISAYEQPMRMFVKRVCPGGWACGAGLAAVRRRAGVCWQGLAREGGVPVPWSSGST